MAPRLSSGRPLILNLLNEYQLCLKASIGAILQCSWPHFVILEISI